MGRQVRTLAGNRFLTISRLNNGPPMKIQLAALEHQGIAGLPAVVHSNVATLKPRARQIVRSLSTAEYHPNQPELAGALTATNGNPNIQNFQPRRQLSKIWVATHAKWAPTTANAQLTRKQTVPGQYTGGFKTEGRRALHSPQRPSQLIIERQLATGEKLSPVNLLDQQVRIFLGNQWKQPPSSFAAFQRPDF